MNIWETTLAIQHFQRLVTNYHKKNQKKPTTTSISVNTVLLMAKPIILPMAKPIIKFMATLIKKHGQPAKLTITTNTKRAKMS